MYNSENKFFVRKGIVNIVILAVCVLLAAACGSEKAIKKGDQYAAVLEYYEAAKEHKNGFLLSLLYNNWKNGFLFYMDK